MLSVARSGETLRMSGGKSDVGEMGLTSNGVVAQLSGLNRPRRARSLSFVLCLHFYHMPPSQSPGEHTRRHTAPWRAGAPWRGGHSSAGPQAATKSQLRNASAAVSRAAGRKTQGGPCMGCRKAPCPGPMMDRKGGSSRMGIEGHALCRDTRGHGGGHLLADRGGGAAPTSGVRYGGGEHRGPERIRPTDASRSTSRADARLGGAFAQPMFEVPSRRAEHGADSVIPPNLLCSGSRGFGSPSGLPVSRRWPCMSGLLRSPCPSERRRNAVGAPCALDWCRFPGACGGSRSPPADRRAGGILLLPRG